MPAAARMFDPSIPPGMIAGGEPTVLIAGLPAARMGDAYICALAPTAGPHPPNKIAKGSTTVRIGGRPAARTGDLTGCGASIVGGALNVVIGD